MFRRVTFGATAAFAVLGGLLGARADQLRVVSGWGLFVDPGKDCRVAEAAGRLSITVPGAYRDLIATANLKNTDAPRLMQAVEGDFSLQVTADRFEFPNPKTPASDQNPTSYVSSGLVVWQDGDTFLRLQRAVNGDGKLGPRPFLHANQFAGGKMVANALIGLGPDEPTHLRIQRRGDRFSLSYGNDGRTWTAVDLAGLQPLSKTVQVGTFVINATNREITHSFTGLQLSK